MKKIGKRRDVLAVILVLTVFLISSFCVGAQNNEQLSNDKIRIEGSLRPFQSSIGIETLTTDRYEVTIELHAPAPDMPAEFTLRFKFLKNKIDQLWNSQTWSNQSFFKLPSYDRAAADFSIISGLTLNDHNQITFTCDDRFEGRFTTTFVQEKNDTLEFGLEFFADNPPISKMQDYEAKVLVDFRNIHFSDAINQACNWRFREIFDQAFLKPAPVIAPVYSTWYPMHRNIPFENITRELDSLQTFGFQSVLMDDGWRALVKMKVDTVYEYESKSLETFRLFDRKRKEMGLKLFMWYSLPFIGSTPSITNKFEGKYLQFKTHQQVAVLDLRYPEIRQHLVGTYSNFYKMWQFDGFWFDFLNHFYPDERVVIEEDDKRDYVDIQLALDDLMTKMNERLQTIDPTLFMGQPFSPVGPEQKDFQNFVAGFVGLDVIRLIREKMVNNRLLYGSFTPFMEIMGVHPRDKSEDVARKFQTIMYGKPHLSFYTATLPDDTKQAISFWLNYWIENQEVLMNAEFEPKKVAKYYPAIKVQNDEKIIYTLYEDYSIGLPAVIDRPIDVINSRESNLISFVVNGQGIRYQYEIHNHLGMMVEQDEFKTKRKNLVELEIPAGGFIRFLP